MLLGPSLIRSLDFASPTLNTSFLGQSFELLHKTLQRTVRLTAADFCLCRAHLALEGKKLRLDRCAAITTSKIGQCSQKMLQFMFQFNAKFQHRFV
jgi:hypothetical protein